MMDKLSSSNRDRGSVKYCFEKETRFFTSNAFRESVRDAFTSAHDITKCKFIGSMHVREAPQGRTRAPKSGDPGNLQPPHLPSPPSGDVAGQSPGAVGGGWGGARAQLGQIWSSRGLQVRRSMRGQCFMNAAVHGRWKACKAMLHACSRPGAF